MRARLAARKLPVESAQRIDYRRGNTAKTGMPTDFFGSYVAPPVISMIGSDVDRHAVGADGVIEDIDDA